MMATSEQKRVYMLVYYAALYAICWYDWLVLLPTEYRKIWKADLSLVKICYLVNRYAMLALTVLVFVGFGLEWEPSRCSYLLGWQDAMPLLVYLSSGFILILRCYAIFGRNKMVLVSLLILHLAHISVSAWTALQVRILPFTGSGPCIPHDEHLMAAFATCLSAFLFDMTASVIALWRTTSMRKQYGHGSPVIDSLIQNGSLYICATVITAAANMAFRFLSATKYHTPMDGFAGGNFCNVINSILVSRLALSLKRDEPSQRTASTEGSGGRPKMLSGPAGVMAVSITTETVFDSAHKDSKEEDLELQTLSSIDEDRV